LSARAPAAALLARPISHGIIFFFVKNAGKIKKNAKTRFIKIQ